ncbi:hypothetical protein WKT22_00298 [Candidatus Lokiarchaeum ossiferum]
MRVHWNVFLFLSKKYLSLNNICLIYHFKMKYSTRKGNMMVLFILVFGLMGISLVKINHSIVEPKLGGESSIYSKYSFYDDIDTNFEKNSIKFSVSSTKSTPFDLYPIANFTASNQIVYVGELVDFFDSSSSGDIPLEYLWDFGDGMVSSLQNTSHSYNSSGIYNVVLLVTDNDGDSDNASLTITVQDNLYPKAKFNYEISSDEIGELVTFTDETTGGNRPLTYYWTFGDKTYSINTNPIHRYRIKGSYVVNLRVTDANGDSDTINRTINIMIGMTPSHDTRINISGFSSEILIFSIGFMVILLQNRKINFAEIL